MLTLAQLIKQVLDEAYGDIPGNEAAKDAAISAEISRLSNSYARLTDSARVAIGYSSPVSRFAYIYKYTVAHADYIMQLIEQHRELRDLFTGDEVSVACLGGGPGSDLLGILKYMIRNGCEPALTCYLFDRERAWGDSWSEVAKSLEADFQLYPVFQQMDVTDPDTWRSYKKFLGSDLFTLSYFMSEIWSFKDTAEPFFDHCYGSAKPGAMFLFIDNNDANGEFASWHDAIAAKHGVEILSSTSCKMAFSNEEEKRHLEPYYSKFGWPKRESNVSCRIGRKSGTA